MTVTVTLDLPPDADVESPEQLVQRLRLLWALDEVRQGRLTRVRAAHVVGLGLDDFLRMASEHGLDAIDYGIDDFRESSWAACDRRGGYARRFSTCPVSGRSRRR